MVDSSADALTRMKQDALARSMGIELLEVRPGYARCSMKVTAGLLNGVGVTQGGAVFTLADFTFGAASNSDKTVSVSIAVNIHFLKMTTAGDTLTAVAEVEHQTRKTGLYRMEVREQHGELVAIAEGTSFNLDH
jgi:acyl-CoA thioesterase